MNNKYNKIYEDMIGGELSSDTDSEYDDSTDDSYDDSTDDSYTESSTTSESEQEPMRLQQNISNKMLQSSKIPKEKTPYEKWLEIGNIGTEKDFENSKNKNNLKKNIILTDPGISKKLQESNISIYNSPTFNSEMIDILIKKLSKEGSGLNVGIFITPKYFDVFKKYAKFKNIYGTHITILNNPIKKMILEFINMVGVPGTEIKMKIKYMLIDNNSQLLYVNFDGPITNFTGNNLYSITLSKDNMNIKNPKISSSNAEMIGPLDINLSGTVQLFK
jgi:hypothetical protein